MLTKNHWYTSNILERNTNKNLDFQVNFNVYDFSKLDFRTAIDLAIEDIAQTYKNFYVALSGGTDSEFVLREFFYRKIPVIPVLVKVGNEEEIKFAFETCRELDINPVVIEITEIEYFNYFVNNIIKRINGVGSNAVQAMIAADYVKKHSGVLLTGEHLLGNEHELISFDCFTYASEWDFYTDLLFPDLINIDLLLYTPEIAFSSVFGAVKYIQAKTWDQYKTQLYNIPFRNKITAKYNTHVSNAVQKIITASGPKPKSQNFWSVTGLLNEFLTHAN